MGLKETFKVLASVQPSVAVPILAEALAEKDASVRSHAFTFAVDSADRGMMFCVIKNIRSLDEAMLIRLRSRETMVVQVIRGMLASQDENGRISGLEALGAMGNPDNAFMAVPFIDEGSTVVKAAAIGSIRRMHESLMEMKRRSEQSEYESTHDTYHAKAAGFVQTLFPGIRSFATHRSEDLLEILADIGSEAQGEMENILLGTSEILRDAMLRILRSRTGHGIIGSLMRMSASRDVKLVAMAKDIFAGRKGKVLAKMLAEYMRKTTEKELLSIAPRMEEIAWWGAFKDAQFEMEDAQILKVVNFIHASSVQELEKLERYEELLQLVRPAVRLELLDKAAACGHAFAGQIIVNALRDQEEAVQLKAAELVVSKKLPDKAKCLTPLLNSKFQPVRKFVSRELSRNSFERYMDSFNKLDSHTREMAGKAIAKIDLDMAEKLAEELQALDPERRVKALKIAEITEMTKDFEPLLMELINDKDKKVRATVIKTISLLGNTVAIKVLVKALNDPDRRTRANAVEAFEDIGNRKLGVFLLPFLRDPDNRVRANAAKALWVLGYPEAQQVLEQMMQSAEDNMRLSAVWALGEINYPAAKSLLAKVAADDTSLQVRKKAAESLHRLETEGGTE